MAGGRWCWVPELRVTSSLVVQRWRCTEQHQRKATRRGIPRALPAAAEGVGGGERERTGGRAHRHDSEGDHVGPELPNGAGSRHHVVRRHAGR